MRIEKREEVSWVVRCSIVAVFIGVSSLCARSGLANDDAVPGETTKQHQLSLEFNTVSLLSWFGSHPDLSDGKIDVVREFTPGFDFEYDRLFGRNFSLGGAFSYFYHGDSGHSHDEKMHYLRLGISVRGVFPLAKDRLQLSAGALFGAGLGIVAGDDGYYRSQGISVLGLLGLRYFFGDWGIAADVRAGYDRAWGDDVKFQLVTVVQSSLGVAYSF